jgi:transposase
MLYLAIDQHSKQLTVNLRNESGEVVLRRQVSTRGAAVEEFLKDVQRRDPEGYMAIVEVCGFNDWLLELLPRCGCREVVLIQPDKRSKTKSDHRDANQLGELLWVNRQRLLDGRKVQGLRRVHPQTPAERDDRRLTMLRRNTARDLTRTINGVRHLLRRHNREQDLPTKGIQTKAAWNWLKALKLSPLDRLELDQLLARWELLAAQQRTLDEQIRQRAAEHPQAKVLQSLPGGGTFLALGLAARVGSIERFPQPRSLANYWGLTPCCRNSGEATDRLGSITKQGSALARFLLGQAVLHVLRRDAWMRGWYARIKKRRGSRIARVAVMRRLTTIIWHMLKHQQPYILGGPPRLKAHRRFNSETAAARA